jgi:tRNA threonylcarbamoyladenosine biosynthesis protein TsaE
MLKKGKYLVSSAEEMVQLGRDFATDLEGHEILAFFGDLGSGKTTFLKGMISRLASCLPDEITSPTFTYLHIYEGRRPIYHFDLFRLTASEQFLGAGFGDYLRGDGICLIEWAEKMEDHLPHEALHLVFEYQGPTSRTVTIS